MERNKVDYSGRTVDLLLLKTVLDVPAVNKRVSLDADGDPMVVTGVEKMVQRYAILFINAIGSTKFRPEHGTEVVPNVSAGLVYNMATLETTAAGANLEALRQMTISDAEEDDTPDDERIVDSEVTNLEFSREKSKIKISVRLTTAAGNSYVYIIPVGVGVH
jgi:hypothetical protein